MGGEDTGRLFVLVERVIATKEQLDAFEDEPRQVRARPPASFELLAQAHRLFDARALAMPRDYERILRAHDGIDHVWRTPGGGAMSVFGHRELFAQRVVEDAAVVSAVIIAASDDGEQVALVPGPMDAPVAVVRNAQGRITGRFPSATAWLEWIHGENSAALDRARLRRKQNLRVTQVVER